MSLHLMLSCLPLKGDRLDPCWRCGSCIDDEDLEIASELLSTLSRNFGWDSHMVRVSQAFLTVGMNSSLSVQRLRNLKG
ncbi:hypothetical protein OIU79_020317 [Salix purpurea]|uniref:Uncharacterized protein n=1 Tax=Salix purpurea TaxID=77065 RepID=A0A9Q0P377_SALPP|nr:hypothetical protein OIU79_020317 [Salix purpurea]